MNPRDLTWKPLPHPQAESRLEYVISRWVGTPYMAGQRVRGAGVDCVQFVTAVLDELHRNEKPTFVPRLRPDSAIHDARQGGPTIKALRQGFASQVVRETVVEPGDVLVVRAIPRSRGPRRMGHVLITGSVPNTLYHAMTGSGVTRTSIEGLDEILRIYRDKNKQRWCW